VPAPGGHHAVFCAARAGALLALDHAHEVHRRLHAEHLGLVVADDLSLASALAALTLRGRADDDLFDPLQMAGQSVAPRMRLVLAPWRGLAGLLLLGQRTAGDLGLDLVARLPRLKVE